MSGLAPPEAARSAFRPEIQALRAFAVLAVVLNHLWPGQLRGGFVGVDVFFVISGFLITSHLVSEVRRTGRVRLSAFWARRARRLLPASLLVLVVCLVGVIALMPMGQWQFAMRQIGASALYVVNWVLTADSQDYFASANSPSPVTHYWSLSVEEQFYIVWPLIIVGALWIAHRMRRGAVNSWIFGVLAIVVGASFVYSLWLTPASPTGAYFSTLGRAWEFGLGGLLGLALLGKGLPVRVAVWGSWLGWAGLFASVFVITEALPFPGTAALLPTLATVLIIASGQAGGAPNLNVVSSFRPIQFFGDISYSLYLWHWPLIIFVPLLIGREMGNNARLAVLVVSIALAWASKRFVEDPFRTSSPLVRRPPWVTLTAMAGAMAILVGACIAPVVAVDQRREQAQEQLAPLALNPPPCFGALAAGDPSCFDSHVLSVADSVLLTVSEEGAPVPAVEEACRVVPGALRVTECVYGPDEQTATRTIAVVGDSHGLHYGAAFRKLAAEEGWRVKMLVQSGCTPIADDPDIVPLWAPDTAGPCRLWADEVVRVAADDPEIDTVVFSSISREYGYIDGTPTDQQDISPSLEAQFARWLDAGKSVLVIADTAFLRVGGIPECLERNEGVDAACSNTAEVVFSKPDPMVAAAERLSAERIAVFNPNEFICTEDGICHAIVGGLPVFSDHNHLNQLFASTLAGPIRDAVVSLEAK